MEDVALIIIPKMKTVPEHFDSFYVRKVNISAASA